MDEAAATQYTESVIEPDQRMRAEILGALAQGNPWVLIVACDEPGANEFSVKMEVGGGVFSAVVVRKLLEKILAGLPAN